MERDGLQAMLLYTNIVRPGAVSYLTGFTPYWSEGILLVPRHGEPIFATALSKRVAEWIRSVSPIGEIVNDPRPGMILAQRVVADAGAKRVGIVEIDAFPAGSFDDFVAAAPAIQVTDATQLFARVRRGADAAERRLLARADAIAAAALDQLDAAAAKDAGSIAGRIEHHARVHGAEEAYIAVAPDFVSEPRMMGATRALPLADRFAVRASIAYKGHWIRRTRTFAKDAAGRVLVLRGDDWFAQALSSLAADTPLDDQIADQVDGLSGAELKGWMAEGCLGSYPLQAIAGSRSANRDVLQIGDFLVLTVELSLDGTPWIGAAPVIVGGGL
jgi:hypothetical protein